MTQMSHGRAMAWLAERNAERVAIVCGTEQVTRGELETRSNRLARDWAARGVGEADLVTIALPNCIEFYVACLAAWKLGATPQPISSRLPEAERRAIIEIADPKLIVGVETGSRASIASLPSLLSLPANHFPESSLADTPLPDRVSQSQRAIASGGSTGRPKLIISKSPALCDPESPVNQMRLEGRVLVPGPLYHTGPFVVSWQAIFSGSLLVVMPRFDAARCIELIEEHRIEWVLFVPTMMQRIWRLPTDQRDACDLTSLRVVMSSGAPTPVWLKRAWIDWIGPEKIFEAYGGSESVGGTRISGTEWLEHPGSVGKPVFGAQMKILDADGTEQPPGEVGRVFMLPPTGPDSTYAYLGSPAAENRDGWITLGDLGYMDADGYLFLVDRETDMIVSGGANVYPAEVEGAIDAHESVRTSAVIGLPDDDLGQRVHAIIDAPSAPSEESLREHLASLLAGYKIPRSFEFVDEPLRDDAGKVRRSALRSARI